MCNATDETGPFNADDLKAFLRFCETCEDGQEYDVPLDRMERLADLGVIQQLGRRRFQVSWSGNILDIAAQILISHVEKAKTDVASLQQTFDLRWDADMRAIKRWQAAGSDRELTWPDRADLVVFLLEQMDAMRKQFDARVAELISYNNEQVERRRDAERRTAPPAVCALRLAADAVPATAGQEPVSQRPIIFLDMDGVVSTPRAYIVQADKPGRDRWLDPISMRYLDMLCGYSNALVVISSTWRLMYDGRQAFTDLLARNGCAAELHEDWRTAQFNTGPRGAEVQDWLDRHPEFTRYLILDDEADFLPGQPLVQTHMIDGFMQSHLQAAFAVLFPGDKMAMSNAIFSYGDKMRSHTIDAKAARL